MQAYARATVKAAFVVRHFAVTLFRISQLFGRRWKPGGFIVKQLNHVITGADLAWQAHVGPGLVLHHPTGVVWGPGTRIGSACRVQQGVTIGGRGGEDVDGAPTIGDGVILGAGCRILGPIEVGSAVMVGANAVVVRSIPAGATAVGVPARILDDRPARS